MNYFSVNPNKKSAYIKKYRKSKSKSKSRKDSKSRKPS